VWWRRKKKDEAADVLWTRGEFESADALDTEAPVDRHAADAMELALERLRGQHLAFRAPARCDECSLEELRLRILTAVTESADLESYYREAWAHGSAPAAAAHEPPDAPAPHRRIAVMQVELMMRAFYALQLQLFANAPENHGWMTLFRSWGRSPRFNRVFVELAHTLAPEFRRFYDLYVRELPARASKTGHLPIHHPWLAPPDARGRGLYMDSGRVEPDVKVRHGAGGPVDQKGAEGADQSYERPSDSGGTGGTPPAPNE
jgi:hypothetical protein